MTEALQSDATEEADATEAGESETPVSVSSAITMSSPQGHEAFLFICLPGPSLLVPCSISIHLFFRSVTGGVRPCPLAMKHFYSLGVRPFPLAM